MKMVLIIINKIREYNVRSYHFSNELHCLVALVLKVYSRSIKTCLKFKNLERFPINKYINIG